MVQFGVSGEKARNERWEASIKDDPVLKSNKRGYVTYAKTNSRNSRSTQVFINFGNNAGLDGQGFSPFGFVTGDGMKIVDSLNSEYGENAPDFQGRLKSYGQPVLDKLMPNIDYIQSAKIVGAADVPKEGF